MELVEREGERHFHRWLPLTFHPKQLPGQLRFRRGTRLPFGANGRPLELLSVVFFSKLALEPMRAMIASLFRVVIK